MPTGLQEWIYRIEEGEGARYIKGFVVLLGFMALVALYNVREFKNFNTQDAMDAAQLARNIASGEGYTTKFIRPFSIFLLKRQQGENVRILDEPHPDLANPPVYPLLLAGLMKVLPFQFYTSEVWSIASRYQPEMLIALTNQFLFLVALILTFLLARRVFDGTVAWIATAALALTDLFWRFSVSGLSTMLLLVWFLALAVIVAAVERNSREESRSSAWYILMGTLAGLFLALGTLTRYSFLALAIPVCLFWSCYFPKRRLKLLLPTLAVAALVISPWLIRNYQLTGAPFGIRQFDVYQGTKALDGTRLERSMNASFKAGIENVTPEEFLKKIALNSIQMIQHEVPRLGGSWLAAFFLVSLLIPFQSPALKRLRIFLVLSLATLFLVQAAGQTHRVVESPDVNSDNLLVLTAPLAFIFGVGLFLILLDQIELAIPQLRALIVVAFILVAAFPLLARLAPPRSFASSYPPYWPPRIEQVAGWMKESELLMSDMPWAIAWYGNQQAIWTTLDAPSDSQLVEAADFYRINDYEKLISGIYLTTLTSDGKFFTEMMQNPDYAWGRFMIESIVRTNVPSGFPLLHAPSGFLFDGQLFLTDRPRWKSPH